MIPPIFIKYLIAAQYCLIIIIITESHNGDRLDPPWMTSKHDVVAVAALAIFSPVLFETDLTTEGASVPPPAAHSV